MSAHQETPDPQAATRTLLSLAHLPASEAEIIGLAAGFPLQRAAVDALYAVTATRYANPALGFRPRREATDWAGESVAGEDTDADPGSAS